MSLSSFSRAPLLFVPWHRQILFPPGKRIIDNESATQKKKKNVNPPPNYSFQFPFFFLPLRPEKKSIRLYKKERGIFLYFFITNQTTTQKKWAGDIAAFLNVFWGKCFYSVHFYGRPVVVLCDLLASNGRDLPQTFFGWAADFLRSNWWNVVVVSFLFFSSPKFHFILECLAYRNSRTKSTCNQDAPNSRNQRNLILIIRWWRSPFYRLFFLSL